MIKAVSEDTGKYSQHYPRLAVIVTARAGGEENGMAVAWHSSISYRPPLFGISVSPLRFTYELIAKSREFAVNFMPFEEAELVAAAGGVSGREVNKFKQFKIEREIAAKITAPIIKLAYAAYECKLVDDREYGDHRWLVGEIVAVHMAAAAFNTNEILDVNSISPALFLGNETYTTISKDILRRLDRKVYGKKA